MTCVSWPGSGRICTYWKGQLYLEGIDPACATHIEKYVINTIPLMDPGLYILCGDDQLTTNVISGMTGTACDMIDLFSFRTYLSTLSR